MRVSEKGTLYFLLQKSELFQAQTFLFALKL